MKGMRGYIPLFPALLFGSRTEFRLWRYLYVVLSRLSRVIAQPNIFITTIKFYRYHLALSYRVTEPFDEYSKFDMRYSVFEYRMLSNIEPFRTLGIFNPSIEPPPITNLFESFRYSIGRFIEYRISNPDRICRKLVYKSSRRGAKWARGNGQWAPAGRTVPNVTPLVGTWGMSLLSLKIGYSDV